MTQPEQWEEEFDAEFFDKNAPSGVNQQKYPTQIKMNLAIKDFIRTLLEREKSQNATSKV